MQQIHIFKGDSTIFADNNKFLTFNIQTNLDLTNWKAKFYLGKIVKTFNDITSKTFDVILTCNDTSTLDYGNIYGVLKLIDSNNNVKTVNNKIPFVVDNKVIENDYQVISLDIPKSTETNIEIVVGNSGGGTFNYDDLFNKPLINDVTLIGNKTATDLGLISTEEFSSALDTKQDVGDYVTNSSLLEKQYITIDDIPSDISYFNNDSGYITEESDPTVPSWAKQPQKPTYTAEEVGALPSDTVIPDISNLVTNQRLQEGLNTKQDKGDYAIKSDIPVNTSDLINNSGFINNSVDNLINYTKSSNLSTVATSGSYNDLTDKPTIPSQYVLPTASTSVLGGVKIDGATININEDGVISSTSIGGTTDYTDLTNKPIINNVELLGSKSLSDLGVQPAGDYLVDSDLAGYAKTSDLSSYVTETELSEKGYLTSVPAEYVTETELNQRDFATTSDLLTISNDIHQETTTVFSNIAYTGNYNDLWNTPDIPDEYTLPEASTTTLGGIKIDGTTITVDNDGVASSVTSGSCCYIYGNNSVPDITLSTGTTTLIPVERLRNYDYEEGNILKVGDMLIDLKGNVAKVDRVNTAVLPKGKGPFGVDDDSVFIKLQIREDDTLTTTSKEIVGAINEINSKYMSKPTENTISDTNVVISILNPNCKYICSNPITNLTIIALDSTKCEIESTIIFTTGDTISVSIPEDVKIIGNYSFEANKSYVMCFWENNLVSAEAKSQE